MEPSRSAPQEIMKPSASSPPVPRATPGRVRHGMLDRYTRQPSSAPITGTATMANSAYSE